MRRPLAVALASVAVLASPADALAVDHVYLSLEPVRLASGWTLTGAVSGADYSPLANREVLGVTLSRRVSSRAVERHALRAHPTVPTISFDGRSGRWEVHDQGRGVLTASLTVTARGDPVALSEWLGCRGSFERVPVTLAGTFGLRTGKAPFGTIRKARLAGTVTYNTDGPVQCGVAPTVCDPVSNLTASDGAGGTVTVVRSHRMLVLYFLSGRWQHVLEVSPVDTVTGRLPRLTIRLPAKLPVRGSGTFAASDSTESATGPCRTVRTRGVFSGTFRATFTGWGVLTFTAQRVSASYTDWVPA